MPNWTTSLVQNHWNTTTGWTQSGILIGPFISVLFVAGVFVGQITFIIRRCRPLNLKP